MSAFCQYFIVYLQKNVECYFLSFNLQFLSQKFNPSDFDNSAPVGHPVQHATGIYPAKIYKYNLKNNAKIRFLHPPSLNSKVLR